MSHNKVKPLNERMFRGSKICRVLENIEILLNAIENELEVNGQHANEETLLIYRGQVQGLNKALAFIKDEFEI